jgi:hypothetical protein
MPRFPTLAVLTLLSTAPAHATMPAADDHMTKAQAREHLAACGAEWQQMKRNGTDGAQIWRDFSASCMARRAKAGAPKTDVSKPDAARRKQP